MPTIQEALKQSGFSEDAIAALDAKALAAFGGILTTAEQKEIVAKEAATKAEQDRQVAEQSRIAAQKAKEDMELQGRSNVEFYETKVVPGLMGYEDEKKALETARINAESAVSFYKTQIEGAKAAGFIPTDAPAFTSPSTPQPVRDGSGRFVANAPGATPGSPTFTMDQVDQRLGTGISNIGWAIQEYQRLTGQFLPDSFDKLTEEASQNKLPFRDYVSRKYDFSGKQQAISQRLAQEHDDKIRTEIAAAKEKESEDKIAVLRAEHQAELRKRAELASSNPDLRPAGPAKIADVRAAVKNGEFKDPLKMTDSERRNVTRQMIHKDIDERDTVAAQ